MAKRNAYDREFEKAANQLAPTFQLIGAIQALNDHKVIADMTEGAGIEVMPPTEEIENLVAAMDACEKQARRFFGALPPFTS